MRTSLIIIFCIVFFACKNEKKKVFVTPLYDYSSLPVDSKNKPIDTLVKDSFSRRTSKILCIKKQTIVFSDYTFSFCKDSVEKIINVGVPKKLISDEFDRAIFLCRQIPFSLIETKTKRNIAAIHYKEKGNQKSYCFEHVSKRPNKCIVSLPPIN
jgi:hypothetical protein